ncbi:MULTISPECIES: 5-dehydro-4-deoxy-D-glucuronate isomerase [Anaerotruncus]|jgi:4-deoxy-L-threo-5-hexosulose-uronate ketol-isomerase|uniref:5-dehydro-4-deoxy-D-glucuronate isomerase n=1 Tax=Anaerotruncus TaxID=244127 RepID=UPI0008347F3D|nr:MULTISPECIES: 5-dehydro-4-deoxy-D-glucuronate isomerase [Anaerotruncus]RGX53607.1 5-dehydro-4-deoxy-D-glucuronate isomerase [Anaerotruncus sp. AF02-27]
MEIKYSISPFELKTLNTREMRDRILIEKVFAPDEAALTYSFDERFILGGIMPVHKEIKLEPADEIRQEYFLRTRELGLINIGGAGTVTADGESFAVGFEEGMYIGCETKEVSFQSADPENPAKFYITSALAFKKYPTVKITADMVSNNPCGSKEGASERIVKKYIHKDGVKSCQLMMGINSVQPGSVWNTLPTHTHKRRVECFMYYKIPENDFYIEVIGEPEESRHIVIRNEQAIVSAAWQMHFGVGTCCYDFIWAMAGENQEFPDMDVVPMTQVK